jgi:hypothetical protein
MPLAILVAFTVLLSEFLRDLLPQPFPLFFPVISGSISAMAASFYCDFMKDTKSSRTAADIRGAIIVMLLAYLFSSLLRQGVPWGRRFFPGLSNIAATLAALYAWNAVVSLKQLFKARKNFDEYTELYQGEKLQEALFGEASLLELTESQIITARRNYLIQIIFIGIILLINTVLGNHPSLSLYILMICVLESGICISGFFGIFRREQYYAGEGLVFSPLDRIKCMLGMGIFTALCIAGAILFSSEKNLLNFDLIIDFFKWLFGLLRRHPPQGIEMVLPEIERPPLSMEMEPFFPVTPEEQRPPLPIWTLLKYCFIVFVAAVFIWFMISPLFNRGTALKKMTVRQKLGRIITEWFKGILNAFTSLFTYIRNYKPRQKLHRKPGAAEILRTTQAVLGAYSHAKRQDIRHCVTLFARLIIWGADVRKVTWKPSHAPAEYCGILAASATSTPPEPSAPPVAAAQDHSIMLKLNEEIIRCGELFEQALYSADVLSDTERKEFKDLVNEITSSG